MLCYRNREKQTLNCTNHNFKSGYILRLRKEGEVPLRFILQMTTVYFLPLKILPTAPPVSGDQRCCNRNILEGRSVYAYMCMSSLRIDHMCGVRIVLRSRPLRYNNITLGFFCRLCFHVVPEIPPEQQHQFDNKSIVIKLSCIYRKLFACPLYGLAHN